MTYSCHGYKMIYTLDFATGVCTCHELVVRKGCMQVTQQRKLTASRQSQEICTVN